MNGRSAFSPLSERTVKKKSVLSFYEPAFNHKPPSYEDDENGDDDDDITFDMQFTIANSKRAHAQLNL